MSKRYTLAIASIMTLPVALAVLDEQGARKEYKFTLTCIRRGIDEQEAILKQGLTLGQFLRGVVTGWAGQELVKDDTGAYAAFDVEAFNALLDIPNMSSYLYGTYMENAGAVKN